MPCTYVRGRTARRARCADEKSVCGRCVVRGAPRSIWTVRRMGMERAVRKRERMTCYIEILVNFDQMEII